MVKGFWQVLKTPLFADVLLIGPMVALIVMALTSNPVQLADVMMYSSVVEGLSGWLGPVAFVGVLVIGFLAFLEVWFSIASLDIYLAGKLDPEWKCFLWLWRPQRSESRHRALKVAAFSHNLFLLFLLQIFLLAVRKGNNLDWAPVGAMLSTIVLFIAVGVAFALMHLGFKYSLRSVAFMAFAPLILFILGLFADGGYSLPLLWAVLGICVVIQYIWLVVLQGKVGTRSWRDAAFVAIIFVGAYEAFQSQFAAEILGSALWCYILGFGMIVLLTDGAALSKFSWIRFCVPPFVAIAVGICASKSPRFTECCKDVNAGTALVSAQPAEILDPFKVVRSHDLDNHRFLAPFVVLDFAGGGSRAAIFSALTCKRLWFLTIPSDDLEKELKTNYGVEKEEYADLLHNLPPEVQQAIMTADGQRVYVGRLLLLYTTAISSVSGGSVTNARLCSELARDPGSTDAVTSRLHALKSLFGDKDEANAWGEAEVSMSDSARLKVIDNDPFISDERKNFLSVVINAAFSPIDSRRQAIEDYWDSTFKWKDLSLSSLTKSEESGVSPIGLFDSTLANTGERLVFTNVSPAFFRGFDMFGARPPASPVLRNDPRRSFVAVPGLSVPHSVFSPRWDPSLTEVVHITSCFPFGFARVRFEDEGTDSQGWSALDGGPVENTGVDTSLSLLRGLRDPQAFVIPPSGQPVKIPPLSMPRLERYRPVLFLSINSSELPVDKIITASGWDNYAGTKQAIWRADRVRDSVLMSGYLAQLQQMFGAGEPRFSLIVNNVIGDRVSQPDDEYVKISDLTDKFGKTLLTASTYTYGYESTKNSGKRWGFFQVRPGEANRDHVATSWHLPLKERQTLYRDAFSAEVTNGLLQTSISFLRMFAKAKMPDTSIIQVK